MRPNTDLDAFRSDERAIEGLPVRLVIALVVGMASLSVMMGMITDIDDLGVSEVDARPSEDVLDVNASSVTVTVVDADGDAVEGATVVVTNGTATLDGPVYGGTDGSGTVRFDGLSLGLRPNQDQGTLEIDIKPPAGSEYTDRRENTRILVVEGASSEA
jgi:hypothetical protein